MAPVSDINVQNQAVILAQSKQAQNYIQGKGSSVLSTGYTGYGKVAGQPFKGTPIIPRGWQGANIYSAGAQTPPTPIEKIQLPPQQQIAVQKITADLQAGKFDQGGGGAVVFAVQQNVQNARFNQEVNAANAANQAYANQLQSQIQAYNDAVTKFNSTGNGDRAALVSQGQRLQSQVAAFNEQQQQQQVQFSQRADVLKSQSQRVQNIVEAQNKPLAFGGLSTVTPIRTQFDVKATAPQPKSPSYARLVFNIGGPPAEAIGGITQTAGAVAAVGLATPGIALERGSNYLNLVNRGVPTNQALSETIFSPITKREEQPIATVAGYGRAAGEILPYFIPQTAPYKTIQGFFASKNPREEIVPTVLAGIGFSVGGEILGVVGKGGAEILGPAFAKGTSIAASATRLGLVGGVTILAFEAGSKSPEAATSVGSQFAGFVLGSEFIPSFRTIAPIVPSVPTFESIPTKPTKPLGGSKGPPTIEQLQILSTDLARQPEFYGEERPVFGGNKPGGNVPSLKELQITASELARQPEFYGEERPVFTGNTPTGNVPSMKELQLMASELARQPEFYGEERPVFMGTKPSGNVPSEKELQLLATELARQPEFYGQERPTYIGDLRGKPVAREPVPTVTKLNDLSRELIFAENKAAQSSTVQIQKTNEQTIQLKPIVKVTSKNTVIQESASELGFLAGSKQLAVQQIIPIQTETVYRFEPILSPIERGTQTTMVASKPSIVEKPKSEQRPIIISPQKNVDKFMNEAKPVQAVDFIYSLGQGQERISDFSFQRASSFQNIPRTDLREDIKQLERFQEPPLLNLKRKRTNEIVKGSLSKALQAYDVYSRRRGKFILIGQGLPIGRARQKGVQFAESTLARYVKLVPRGTTSAPDVRFDIPESRFRQPKSRTLLGGVVERNALSSRSEVMEIQQARRSRRARL